MWVFPREPKKVLGNTNIQRKISLEKIIKRIRQTEPEKSFRGDENILKPNCGEFSCGMGVKDLLSLQQLASLLWHRFNLWHGNFHLLLGTVHAHTHTHMKVNHTSIKLGGGGFGFGFGFGFFFFFFLRPPCSMY